MDIKIQKSLTYKDRRPYGYQSGLIIFDFKRFSRIVVDFDRTRVVNRIRTWEHALRKCGLHGKIDGYVEKKPNGYES